MLDGVLHFASEIKALKSEPGLGRRRWISTRSKAISRSAISWRRDTVYRHVRKLEPGHWLRASTAARRDPQVLGRHAVRHRSAAASANCSTRSTRACRPRSRERLESEVPLGAFLSGGIDSGLVVSYMAEALGGRLSPTSVGFGDAAHNELEAAALTAERFHTRHHTEIVEPRLDEVLDPIVDAFDEPFADSSAIPTYLRRQGRARARHRGAERRRRRRDVRRLRIPLRAARDGRPRSRSSCPARPARGRGLARRERGRDRRRCRDRCGSGTLLENLGRDPAAAYYADLCFLKPHDARGAARPVAAPRSVATARCTRRSRAPYRRMPVRQRGAARAVRRSQDLPAERRRW